MGRDPLLSIRAVAHVARSRHRCVSATNSAAASMRLLESGRRRLDHRAGLGEALFHRAWPRSSTDCRRSSSSRMISVKLIVREPAKASTHRSPSCPRRDAHWRRDLERVDRAPLLGKTSGITASSTRRFHSAWTSASRVSRLVSSASMRVCASAARVSTSAVRASTSAARVSVSAACEPRSSPYGPRSPRSATRAWPHGPRVRRSAMSIFFVLSSNFAAFDSILTASGLRSPRPRSRRRAIGTASFGALPRSTCRSAIRSSIAPSAPSISLLQVRSRGRPANSSSGPAIPS